MPSPIPAIDPTRASLGRFQQQLPGGKPIVMLNLLRFRAEAAYRDADAQAPCSGRAAYAEYSRQVLPLLDAVGGKLLWLGRAHAALIAPAGEEWDEVLLVQYPSKEAFMEMIGSAEYRAIVHHRTAALTDSRLVATLPVG
jgi:uncharacterized protein (DUF1330 family)